MIDIDKVLWHIDRFKSMNVPEIMYRINQRFIEILERFKYKRIKTKLGDTKSIKETWVNTLIPFFRFKSRGELKKQYKNIFPKRYRIVCKRCLYLIEQDIKIFGENTTLDKKINWLKDPFTGNVWPNTFYADINIRDNETIGGVKWVWELNRHHHLVTLGKGYYLTGDKKYAREVCSQFESWIEVNPPLMGVNWTSPLELAVRLLNWSWALGFIQDSEALTGELKQRIQRSICQQAQHIQRHLSAYSSANNHLIGEAAGLAVIGLTFPDLPDADKWRDTGLGILEREIGRQIHPDGVPAEQAVHYLAFILDLNLFTWLLAEQQGFLAPDIWWERFEAACEFLIQIMDHAGNVPALGDSDDAWVVRLDDQPGANNYRSLLATAAVIFKRADFKKMAGAWDEKSHWLLGDEGRRTFNALSNCQNEQISRAFRHGGYCVMRASGRIITFDCGPLGYLSIAAHGHADALSFTLNVNDHPVLIDPGTYAYQEGGEKRDYFRSTAAHNTVVIDDQNQSEMLGTFLWGKKAQAELLHWETNDRFDVAAAEHDGYQELGVIHRRKLIFQKPDWLIVEDYLEGKGEHSFAQLWHFSSEAVIKYNQSSGVYEINCGDGISVMFIPLFLPTDTENVKLKGSSEPFQGWQSPSYGKIVPAPVLKLSGTTELPERVVSAFYLSSEDKMESTQKLVKQAEEIHRMMKNGEYE